MNWLVQVLTRLFAIWGMRWRVWDHQLLLMPSPNFRRKLSLACAAIIATIVADPIYALYPAFSVHSFISAHSTIETNLAIGDRVFATPRDYGAKGDAKTLADGAISSGSAIFTSSSAGFTSADVRKAIAVSGAGTRGAALVGLISVVNSATSVTLSAAASTTVSGTRADYGTDDTAAVRSCVQKSTLLGGRCTINDGAGFMMSNASTTISIAGANVAGGMIDGKGSLIFAPQGPLTAGSNDRLFYVASSEAAEPFQVRSGPIARGASSFTAQNLRDAAQLSRGDWVIMTEKDGGATDVVYSDWVQVSRVVGATVNIVGQFRMSFPNARAYNNSGSPVPCISVSPCGLSFRKLTNVVRALTIKDINIFIPKVINGNRANGIATRDTRDVHIHNVTCDDASANCYAGYLDKGLVFTDNHMNASVYPEFAGQVDTTAIGNHINTAGTNLFGFVAPQTGGFLIDFGTGFSRFERNTIGNNLQACFILLSGVHDIALSRNTCGWTSFGTGAACILVRGSYRNTIERNVCLGGDGASSFGITLGDSLGFTLNISSFANSVRGNRVSGYVTLYDVGGADVLETHH
jgi:hypothetical protein